MKKEDYMIGKSYETTKKFELTSETKELCGRKLFRIKALKSFSDVIKGDLGGFDE